MMDRIDPVSNPDAYINAQLFGNKKSEQKKNRRAIGTTKTGFAKIFERFTLESSGELGPLAELPPSDGALQGLLDEVRSAGDTLRDRPFEQEILAYKKAVRNFVHYVVENSYNVDKRQTRFRELRNWNPFVQVHIIDQKLDELAAVCMTGQAAQLEIVSRVDEIKGLLVDLTVTGGIKNE
jgi:uncharacterized protein YaaR (DUF327 family)